MGDVTGSFLQCRRCNSAQDMAPNGTYLTPIGTAQPVIMPLVKYM